MLILNGHNGVPDAFNPLRYSSDFFLQNLCVQLRRLVCDCLLKVSGADDDSNFDLVEESPPVPDIASLKPNKEFRYPLFLY